MKKEIEDALQYFDEYVGEIVDDNRITRIIKSITDDNIKSKLLKIKLDLSDTLDVCVNTKIVGMVEKIENMVDGIVTPISAYYEHEHLSNNLWRWRREYYNESKPSVSDAIYDGSWDELLKLEKSWPILITKFSPSQTAGVITNNDNFVKVEHDYPMLSISNSINESELLAFGGQIDKIIPNESVEYVVENKIDGLGVALRYKNGKLVKALTRGNGGIGEDITKNVLTIKDIPHNIKYKNDIEFRGEIYMSDKTFDDLNKNGHNFANPRNAASGSIKQKSSIKCAKRNLSAFIYTICDPLSHNISTQEAVLKFIDDNGMVANKVLSKGDINKILEDMPNIEKMRNKQGFAIDGAVVKVNEIKYWDRLGSTSNHPRFFTAYKFKEELVETVIDIIEWQVGRTGKMTPVAKIKPTRVAGSTISSITLHNIKHMAERGIRVGEPCLIFKAGAVIPRIERMVNPTSFKTEEEFWDYTNFEKPTICVVCYSTLTKKVGYIDTFCPNKECKGRLIASIIHFIGVDYMNIKGLGEANIRRFVELGLLNNVYDLYEITYGDIISLEGFGDKSASKIIDIIEKSKTQELFRFIAGLGIHLFGKTLSKTIVTELRTLDKILEAHTNQEWLTTTEVTDAAKSSFVEYMSNGGVEYIQRFIQLGIKPSEPKVVEKFVANTSKLQGEKYQIGDDLLEEEEFFKNNIEKYGGIVVKDQADYIISDKLEGDNILTEDKFLDKVLA